MLKHPGNGTVEVSLSHDDRACFCVAGPGPQGCDVAVVSERTREQWQGLLGGGADALLDRLLASADRGSLDRAGTRIWAATEALRKATDARPEQLVIDRQDGDAVLFRGGTSDSALAVLTFPLDLIRGPVRLLAVVVEPKEQAIEPDGVSIAEEYDFNPSTYTMDVTKDGPVPDMVVLGIRFPVTFREVANLSRTLYFSHYFIWMGKVRELACQPIYQDLASDFVTGKWGMVSNYGELRILDWIRADDVVEGRCYAGPYSGTHGSVQELHYEWRRILPGGGSERVAWSRMEVTWVAIVGHGVVEPRPFPDYYQRGMDRMTPPDTPEVRASLKPQPSGDVDLGQVLWAAPPGPVNKALLREQVFETSLEDSNLVGNLYFANYYLLHGRTRDHFFHDAAPDYYLGTGERGELRCMYCRIDHLREAMPFDRIAVRLSLDALHEFGARLRIDLYRATDDGGREKLGSGRHVAGWFVPDADGRWTLGPLPDVFRNAILEQAERAQEDTT
ncbi:MAG: thioesterase family protein [Gaiellaceae bacterium]